MYNVVGLYGSRFFVGFPLITADGFIVGVLSIADTRVTIYATEGANNDDILCLVWWNGQE